MSLLDRSIEAISPEWAAKRQAARLRLSSQRQLARLQKRYAEDFRINDQAARASGRKTFRKGPLSAPERERLWRLFRFNPFARKMMNNLLNNVVGYGITGTPTKPSEKLRTDWAAWQRVCDWDGVLDFAGLQELIVRTFLLDAGVFIVFRVAKGVTGNPLRLQVLSVDQLATPAGASAKVQHGIEFESGRPVAFHFRTMPASMTGGLVLKTERIAASDVIYFFERPAPGFWFGWPHFEAVLEALEGGDEYLESESVRKRLESCFTAMVTRSIDADPSSAVGDVAEHGPIGEDGDELRAEAFYPGMIMYGEPGEDIKFGEPKAAGGLADFLRWNGIRAAAGGQVTYEGLTGDLSNVTFASYRAGEKEFKRFVGRLQWTVGVIPRVLDPIWDRFGRVQEDTGRTPKGRTPAIVWSPPAFESIDRAGDAKAALLELDAGLESRRSLLGERGYDFDQKMGEIADDMKAQQKLGLGFSGDPKSPAAESNHSGGPDDQAPGADG